MIGRELLRKQSLKRDRPKVNVPDASKSPIDKRVES